MSDLVSYLYRVSGRPGDCLDPDQTLITPAITTSSQPRVAVEQHFTDTTSSQTTGSLHQLSGWYKIISEKTSWEKKWLTAGGDLSPVVMVGYECYDDWSQIVTTGAWQWPWHCIGDIIVTQLRSSPHILENYRNQTQFVQYRVSVLKRWCHRNWSLMGPALWRWKYRVGWSQ